MRLTARSNLAEVESQLDAFVDSVETVAASRALNALRDQAQTAGFRKVNDLYQVGPRTMERYAETKPATSGDTDTTITVKGKGFSLDAFQPRRTSTGVSVLVKGRRFEIPHAFMVDRFGQHVFARGSYGGKAGGKPTGQSFGSFQFGKARLPIHELYTFGPVQAFSNDEVTQAMDDRVAEQGPSVMAREIKAAVRGF